MRITLSDKKISHIEWHESLSHIEWHKFLRHWDMTIERQESLTHWMWKSPVKYDWTKWKTHLSNIETWWFNDKNLSHIEWQRVLYNTPRRRGSHIEWHEDLTHQVTRISHTLWHDDWATIISRTLSDKEPCKIRVDQLDHTLSYKNISRIEWHESLTHWVLTHWVVSHWIMTHSVITHWVMTHGVMTHWVMTHWVMTHWVMTHRVMTHIVTATNAFGKTRPDKHHTCTFRKRAHTQKIGLFSEKSP